MRAQIPSTDRAAQALREIMMGRPHFFRNEMVDLTILKTQCGRATAYAAIKELTSDGHIKSTGVKNRRLYFWEDNPVAVDHAPRVVTTVDAKTVPTVSDIRFPSPMAWGLHHCLRAFA